MTTGRLATAALVVGLVVAAGCTGDEAPEDGASAVTVTADGGGEVGDPPARPAAASPGTAPLTGEPVAEDVAAAPALVVKIDNGARATPQAGLEVADVVIEELVEGGVTRLLAVFHTEVPRIVGPVRSSRLVDADLLPAFGGGYLHSGARPEVRAAIEDAAVLLTDGAAGTYRDRSRRAPSDLMAEGETVRAALLEQAPDLDAPAPLAAFADTAPDGACETCDGSSIDVAMSARSTSSWRHDPAAGGYVSVRDGLPRTTFLGDEVVAANVVLVEIDSWEGGCCDSAGSPYVVSRTLGEGRAVLLRDGRWYEAGWARATPTDQWAPFRDGELLPLAPGPTWIHLVPAERMPPAP